MPLYNISDTILHSEPLGAGKLEGEVHLKVLQQSSASIAAKSRHLAASPAAPAAISISSTSASSQAAGSSQQGTQPSSKTKVDASAAAAHKASFDCGPTKSYLRAHAESARVHSKALSTGTVHRQSLCLS